MRNEALPLFKQWKSKPDKTPYCFSKNIQVIYSKTITANHHKSL
jgi:hypothetical protein